MTINGKQKGKRGELELVKKLKEYGYDKARRTAQYCGNTGDAADITGALDGIHIECKRVEKLNIYDAVNQAKRDAKGGLLPTLFHRKNNCEWLVTMPLDSWMRMYQDYEPPVPFADLEGEENGES